MGFRLTISTKLIAITWAAVGVTAITALAIQRSTIRKQGIELTHRSMQNAVQSAEGTRESLASLVSVLDNTVLQKELRSVKDYRQTKLYASVPIIGAMKTLQQFAARENFQVRIPSKNPRNPANAASPEEMKILDYFTQNPKAEYFEVDEQRNELVFARPISATQDCMSCHGEGKNSPTHDGKDILGFRMEGFKAGDLRGAFILRSSLANVDGLVQEGMIRSLLWLVPCAIVLFLAAVAFSRSIRKAIKNIVGMLQKVASGDLTQHMSHDSDDEIGDMAVALNKTITQLRAILSEVQQLAQHVAGGSSELTAASEQLSSGVSTQASCIQETSASMEELTTTVRQNADNASKANQISTSSRQEAEKGGQAVVSAIDAMKEISASSRKIADIISTIDDIAFQTNLLALNAAVEAARAGDQGRGFAVVAAEVRTLAQRSATAAKEIKGLIHDSGRKVDAGSSLVNHSGETLNAIVDSVKRLSGIVAEIASASSDQASGLTHVNEAILQVDRVTQENSAQTEQLAATAQNLSKQAARMLELAGQFKL